MRSEKSISLTDRNSEKCYILYYTFFFLLEIGYIYMMRKVDDNWKITKRSKWCYVCMYTRLWPSSFAFDLLFFLSLFFFFRKTARIQAHHMCYRRAHPFFFFPVLCLTCSIITPILHVDVCVRRKKTNRERERTKDAKKLSIECV